MACTQFIPALRINPLYTYWAPLGFVIAVGVIREAIEDIRRAYRDREINSQRYTLLCEDGQKKEISSSKIKVSDILVIQKKSTCTC